MVKTTPKPAWTPKVIEDTDEQLRQELVLIRAQIENRLAELDHTRERLKDSFDRITTLIEMWYPATE